MVVLVILGAISIAFPQLLGNGKEITQLAFVGGVAPALMLALLFLKPAATASCLGSGIPGGLLTPSLTFGAMLGGVLGHLWSLFWPGVPPGFFALVGAAAVLAATTQGPISAIVIMMELTVRDRSVRGALAAGGRHRDAGGPKSRQPIDLRRPPDRPAASRPPAGARPDPFLNRP